MTIHSAKRALRALPGKEEPSYEVGFGKPPSHTRFKPGQSGNPRGRPRGARNKRNRIPALNEERLKTVVLEEAYRTIGVRDGDRLVEIPVIQAIIRGIALNAAKGHQKSQRMFAELLQQVERENKALHDELLNTAIGYKVDWERELYRRELRGESGPEPLPHPDDIVINMQTGLVEFHGPMTKEEKVKWNRLLEQKDMLDEDIAMFEKMAKKKPGDQTILKHLKKMRRAREMIAAYLSDQPQRICSTR